jgi:hypothetical protein
VADTRNMTNDVTRIEIIDAIEHAFDGSSARKQELITAAIQQDSRAAVLDILHRLPERSFSHVRDLWDHLPDIPLGE